jgi:hypothetical protein
MNLATDIATDYNNAEGQWHWIYQGLKIFDKAIARNQHHPRVWKLYKNRAFLIGFKCLPSSEFSPFADFCYRKYREIYGRDPHEDMLRDYRKLFDYADKVPRGWLFSYALAYETWALNAKNPEEQLKHMRQAVAAWEESLAREPRLDDVRTRELLKMKQTLCEKYLDWCSRGDAFSRKQWLAAFARLTHAECEDLLLEKQGAPLTVDGKNVYVSQLLLVARDFFENSRILKAKEIGEYLYAKHKEKAFKGWEASFLDLLHLMAPVYDLIQGSISHELAKNKGKEEKKVLIREAVLFKNRALTVFRKILEYEKDNEEVKEKISKLENELRSQPFNEKP